MSGLVDDMSDSLVDKVYTRSLAQTMADGGEGGPIWYFAPRSCVTQGGLCLQ